MTGIVMAFKKYSYAGGIWGSPWNGFDNFKFFFKSGQAGLVTRNTVLYNLAFIAINTTMQIAVAVLLTEIRNKHYRKITQSLMFLPYFIFLGYRRSYGIQYFQFRLRFFKPTD